MFIFDPLYFIMIAPALLLAGWAQMKVKSTYARGMKIDARLSGAAAARHILDQDGCQDVNIEETHGTLSDHYDPRHRVLRLSRDVYHPPRAKPSSCPVRLDARFTADVIFDARSFAFVLVETTLSNISRLP